ncbi:SCO family protein [Sphingomonas oligophenolica]|uniref:SCO family protein n=1 Tax=Sphingomonas oligophenolica TaxID=301154 RepID=A0ABU9Y2J6_9SPHN
MNETRARRTLPIRALSVMIGAALLVTACTGPAPTAKAPLQGAKIGGPFALTDQNGHPVTDRNFAGKYRIMYFGYTFCPDVCPVDVQNIGAGLRILEKSDPQVAAKIVPIFISVDPARDTPAVLKAFVGAFHPRMVGLTGSPAAIDAVAKEYAIYYHKQDAAPGGGYMVDHSRVAYLMDPEGKPLALLPQDQSGEAIAAEARRWVK